MEAGSLSVSPLKPRHPGLSETCSFERPSRSFLSGTMSRGLHDWLFQCEASGQHGDGIACVLAFIPLLGIEHFHLMTIDSGQI